MALPRREVLRMVGVSGAVLLGGAVGAAGLASPASAAQQGWRWCWKCEGMWFSGNGSGKCQVWSDRDGTYWGHSSWGSGSYELKFAYEGSSVSGQAGWRWCTKCQGLWLLDGSTSYCPAGAVGPNFSFSHSSKDSGDYFVEYAWVGGGQSGWKRCLKCQWLWFTGRAKWPYFAFGACSADGQGHAFHAYHNNLQVRQR